MRTFLIHKQKPFQTIMKNDPYTTSARFASKCAESGKSINKGEPIIYWPTSRKVYLIGSAPKAEKEFREFQSLAFEEDHGYCTY